jgi:hypothetical protein
MKTFVTVPVTVVSPRAIRQPRVVYYKIDAKRSLLKRFRHFIESTDWERRYLCHKGIDKVCLGIIVISLLYFVPVLGPIILR